MVDIKVLENIGKRLKHAVDESIDLETKSPAFIGSYVDILDSLRNSVSEIQEEIESAVRQQRIVLCAEEPSYDPNDPQEYTTNE